jgi:hypothetical protein
MSFSEGVIAERRVRARAEPTDERCGPRPGPIALGRL